MRINLLSFLLILLLLLGIFWWGRSVGRKQSTTTFIENKNIIRQIAELSSLEISGSQEVKISNADNENNYFAKIKNFFFENTLAIAVPYKGRYGIDLNDKLCDIKKIKSDSAIVILPACILQSLQLEMDKLNTYNQSGIFNGASIEDLKQAEKILYRNSFDSLSVNEELINKAQTNIIEILKKYYLASGIKAGFIFQKKIN